MTVQPDDGGVAGNTRLTALMGAVVFVMLAVEGVSILALDQLFPVHVFVGLALIPVVAVKLGATGYRMLRYYVGTAAYRLRGPPPLGLRLLGPVLALSAAVVLGSGVGLLFAGRNGTIRSIHSASFVVFGIAVAMHVLAHLRTTPRLVGAEASSRSRPPGVRRRWLAALLSVLTGAVLATAVITADPAATQKPHHHHDRGEAKHG